MLKPDICRVLDEMRNTFCRITEEKTDSGLTLSTLRQWDQTRTMDYVIDRIGITGMDAFRFLMFSKNVVDDISHDLSKINFVDDYSISGERQVNSSEEVYPATLSIMAHFKNGEIKQLNFFDDIKKVQPEMHIQTSCTNNDVFTARLDTMDDVYKFTDMVLKDEDCIIDYCCVDSSNGCSVPVYLSDISYIEFPAGDVMDVSDLIDCLDNQETFLNVVCAEVFVKELNEKYEDDVYDVSKMITDLYQIGLCDENQEMIEAMQLAMTVYTFGTISNENIYCGGNVQDILSDVINNGIDGDYELFNDSLSYKFIIDMDTYDVNTQNTDELITDEPEF